MPAPVYYDYGVPAAPGNFAPPPVAPPPAEAGAAYGSGGDCGNCWARAAEEDRNQDVVMTKQPKKPEGKLKPQHAVELSSSDSYESEQDKEAPKTPESPEGAAKAPRTPESPEAAAKAPRTPELNARSAGRQ